MHKLEKVVCGKSNQTKRKIEKKIFIFLTSITMQNIRNWFMRSVLFLFILWLWKSYKSAAYTCSMKFSFLYQLLFFVPSSPNKYPNKVWSLYDECVPANISTSDQCCFNVVDQRWNNVDPTLKTKQNPTSDSQRCTTLIQPRCPTLKQRWYNFILTLFQRVLNISKSYI